jgi:small-conductance mechanosensitive channel/CRP-like cAMP-binding protein
MKTNKRHHHISPRVRYSFFGPIVFLFLALLYQWSWRSLRNHIDFSNHSTLSTFFNNITVILYTCSATMILIIGVQFIAIRYTTGLSVKLIRQVTSVGIWTIVFAVVSATIFEVPVGSLVTTSGLMVAVVGLAVRSLIADVLTGMTLPLKIGDTIASIEEFPVKGKVVEIGWRSITLLTNDAITIIVPNSHLVATSFENYSRPHAYYRDSFRLYLPISVSAHQVKRNLIAAARQIDEATLIPISHQPEVRVHAFHPYMVEWELLYYVPDAEHSDEIRFKIQRNVMRNLYFSGIIESKQRAKSSLQAGEKMDDIENGALFFLSNIDLFGSLTDEELIDLSSHVSPQIVYEGNPVVSQGESGKSLFVVREGLLDVTILLDGVVTTVGKISPGHFFGEMSLLTGEPRSATVTPVVDSIIYEISQEVLTPILQNRHSIAEQMSEILAERQSANRPKNKSEDELNNSKSFLAAELMSKIVAFFSL